METGFSRGGVVQPLTLEWGSGPYRISRGGSPDLAEQELPSCLTVLPRPGKATATAEFGSSCAAGRGS